MSNLIVVKREDAYKEEKSWGYELWFVNNDAYCGKLLKINKDKHTSMHFHMKKHETMFVKSGNLCVDYIDTASGLTHQRVLFVGDSIVIPNGVPHILSSLTGCEVMEFSTHHENSDSYRVMPPCE